MLKDEQLRRGRHEVLFQEDHLLDRGPAGAAPFLRPGQRRPALGIEDALPAHGVFLARRMAKLHPVTGVGGQVFVDESADFLAEGELFRGEAKIHGLVPPTGR